MLDKVMCILFVLDIDLKYTVIVLYIYVLEKRISSVVRHLPTYTMGLGLVLDPVPY